MTRLSLIAAALMVGASPLAAQTVAITNGTVVLGDGSEPIVGGTVVVRTGKIVAVEVSLNPDPNVKSGVHWTKDVAPDIALKKGMSVSGDVITALQRPISLIIPIDERGR